LLELINSPGDVFNVVFSPTGTERDVTPDDMRRANNQYRSEFFAELRKLRK
jgi:hypothetical protein